MHSTDGLASSAMEQLGYGGPALRVVRQRERERERERDGVRNYVRQHIMNAWPYVAVASVYSLCSF